MKGWEAPLLADVLKHLLLPTLRPLGRAEPGAVWFLLVVGGTESGFGHSLQRGPRGEPVLELARGWWQFELTGVEAVLRHWRSRDWLLWAIPAELLREGSRAVWLRLAWDGALAATVARGLLWTNLRPLPEPGDVEEAWRQYMFLWRPGKPNKKRFLRWAEAANAVV